MNDLSSLSWSVLFHALEEDLRTRGYGGFRILRDDGLWQEAHRRIRTVAFVQPEARTFTADAIEDTVQSFMLRLQDPNLVHAIGSAEYPRAFVARSIRNLLTDQRRAAQRSVAAMRNYAAAAPWLSPPLREVHEVLEGLTAEEREMLYRRFWYGQSLGEIAAAQRLPYSTVAKRMFRLLAKLRSQIGHVQ
jgi:RNA polymerase sigma factor (sigma-70 family)